MKVEKKESSPCVLALSVQADAEEIKGEYQKVLTAFIRNAIVPGFRKGKIPLPILKQKFQVEISQESQQACFRKLYPEALKEAAVEPLALQDVTDLSFSPERGFSFTALVEVPPKFDLPKYVDPQTGFISQKSKNGKELKALELPGLWNGAMSDWNTVFVEVPIETFNPVKTVNDLLRPQHQ